MTLRLNPSKSSLRQYPDVLNIDQMCEILDISTKTGYQLLKDNAIQYLKVRRSYRIPKLHLIDYLTSRRA